MKSDMDLSLLEKRLSGCGLALPGPALEGLAAYLGMLLRWGKVMNLVGAKSWQEAADNLAADSFRLAAFLESLELGDSPETFDLGAGAGIPGVPLRLVWRAGRYTMVEKRSKRAFFLKQVLGTVDLGSTFVFQGDVADFFLKSGPADLIVSRAFMPWRKLLCLAFDALKPGGRLVCMENERLDPSLLPEGWALERQSDYASGKSRRWLWSVRKDGGPDAR